MSKSIQGQPAVPDATAVAEIAHELRSPLGGIEAMASLLRRTGLSPEQMRLVDGLCAAAEHLRAVASDILDESAGRAGHLACEDKALDLRSFVDSLAISAEARASAKGLSFDLSFDKTIAPSVLGDARRIRQMLENLLDNAIKVTETGGIRLSVAHVDRRGAFEGLRFVVEDTGPGFTAEQAAQLFRSFGRIDNGVAGTGIGLAMVRRFAHSMGGEAGCEGRPGNGATFWFTLRLKQPQGAGDDAARAADGSAAPEHRGNRILVVDDNQANRMIMAAMLEHFGFEMAEACSAEQALNLLPGGRFAAVMMDQTLPGMSGLDALKLIRAMPQPLADLPVIPVTGRVSPADKAAFAAAGANGFLEKPVNARAVREALDKALGVSGKKASKAA
jgi:two-component system, sensor histidine kinase